VLTVFDIGMYDGADTKYYLESGFRVVAVEGNPDLVASAQKSLASYVSTGQLVCVNKAISADGEPVELTLSGADLGASSTRADRIASRWPIGKLTVAGATMRQLIDEDGVPHFIKSDIERADRFCVLGLDAATRPQYLSYEVGEDFDELLRHCRQIGYSKFKIVNQVSFRELANQRSFRDRLILGVTRRLGYADFKRVKRAGRFFISGHSAGPAPWCSDGAWRSADETLARWTRAKETGALTAWYDVHATA
jgi:FkbM family methyltransferase